MSRLLEILQAVYITSMGICCVNQLWFAKLVPNVMVTDILTSRDNIREFEHIVLVKHKTDIYDL